MSLMAEPVELQARVVRKMLATELTESLLNTKWVASNPSSLSIMHAIFHQGFRNKFRSK